MYQGILTKILKRIDATGDPIFSWDEVAHWPIGALECFIKIGILNEIEPVKSIECDGCEENCIEELEFVSREDGQYQGYIACHKRDDVGRISVQSERLRQWRINVRSFATVLAKLLDTTISAEERINDRLWWLGHKRIKTRRVDFFFLRGLYWEDAQLIFGDLKYLQESSMPIILIAGVNKRENGSLLDGKIISLLRILSFDNKSLMIDLHEVEKKVKKGRLDKSGISISFPTPSGAKWENLRIEFVSDTVLKISVGDVVEHKRFDEMGFCKITNKDKCTNQWVLLRILAENEGKISWQDIEKSKGIEPNKVKKQISELRKKLRVYFKIQDDPFKAYRKVKGYETKFILIPETKKNRSR